MSPAPVDDVPSRNRRYRLHEQTMFTWAGDVTPAYDVPSRNRRYRLHEQTMFTRAGDVACSSRQCTSRRCHLHQYTMLLVEIVEIWPFVQFSHRNCLQTTFIICLVVTSLEAMQWLFNLLWEDHFHGKNEMWNEMWSDCGAITNDTPAIPLRRYCVKCLIVMNKLEAAISVSWCTGCKCTHLMNLRARSP
jgi:hypothetical protein